MFMKRVLMFACLLVIPSAYGAAIYLGSSTSGSAAYIYSESEKRLYRGSSTSGSAIFTYEPGNTPRIYRGSSTSGSAIAVIEQWDEVPKTMLMFIVTLLGE